MITRIAAVVLMSVLVVKAFLLPGLAAAGLMAVLYGAVVVTLVLKIELGKYILPFFGIFCLVSFVVFRVSRPWLLLTITGLLLCYELLEFSFRHDAKVGNVELHKKLMRAHLVYLGVVFTLIVGLSFGVLFLFERIAFRFSESLYVNALVFSVIFFAVLYILRYASK